MSSTFNSKIQTKRRAENGNVDENSKLKKAEIVLRGRLSPGQGEGERGGYCTSRYEECDTYCTKRKCRTPTATPPHWVRGGASF
jgi:hypothetical protein